MKQKIVFGTLMFCVCILFRVSAQYERILTPLSAEEIAKYKNAGVKMEKQEATGNIQLSTAENKIRYISPDGLLLGQFTYKERQYFMYDEAGKVARALDSLVVATDKFDVFKYSVNYAANGKPQQMVINKDWSTFQWDAAKNELTETLSHDTPAVNVYKYDGQGRLIMSKSFTQSRYLLEKHELNYTKGGLLYTEILVQYNGASKDSIAAYYFYNDKTHV
jgi:hypothetical protein